tara:strand:- start:233 stop:1240 length:1008 start_codon:yes stop_codon:yes gene_type:complete
MEVFLKQQQEIIRKQQIQIEALLNEQQKEKIDVDNREYLDRLNHVQEPSMEQNKLRIDPYKILDIAKNYDERSLKKAYLKLATRYHPDKGGDPKKFKIITLAYKILLKKYQQRNSDKIHNDLKKGSKDYIKRQSSNNKQNINLKKNFSQETFNREFESNRMKDDFSDKGYGDFMKQDSIDTQIDHSKLNENNFNEHFQKLKSKKKSSQLQKYSEPEELVSMGNRDSIMILGKERVKSYTGESNGLHYRDLKEAYTESTLIDVNSVDTGKRSDNIQCMERERSRVRFQMSEDDMKLQALRQQKTERDEAERIKYLQQRDEQIGVHYERVHQRLMGI